MSDNDTLPLAIDRRPVRMINCFNGDLNDPLMRAAWWADDETAVTDLETRLSGGYLVGYRRFMLILPAGYPHNQHLMPSSQWLTMPRERRHRLMALLPRWKERTRDPSVKIYVYAGFALADPRKLEMPEQRDAETPDITRDWAWFQANWRGWIEDCRIDGIGFDNSSNPKHVAAFVRVARVLSIAGIKCIGEAIPFVSKDGELALAEEVKQAPWFALDQFIANRDKRRRWRFDPTTTECGVGFRESMRVPGRERRATTERDVREFVSRGLIPYVYTSKWDEVVMELTG